MWADYFTTFVKVVDEAGEEAGYSVLCIPRSERVETRAIKTLYSPSAGTAFIVFDSAHVPAQYVVGEDGIGVPVVLSNFNHERYVQTPSLRQRAKHTSARMTCPPSGQSVWLQG